MNIFKKAFLKVSFLASQQLGYIQQIVGILFSIVIDPLRKKWSLEGYKELEDVRRFAQDEDVWFEELAILLEEIKLLIKNKADKQLFYTANARLSELSEFFDMDDDAFANKFKEVYLHYQNQRILNQIIKNLRGYYNIFYNKADWMKANLQYNAAIVCGKAICKIASVSNAVSFEGRMETLFQIADCYGSIGEGVKAMEYYDKAICLAKEAEDLTYEYIAILRKLSICQVTVDIGVLANMDKERIVVVKELLTLCDRFDLNPYEFGEELLRVEKNKFRKNRIQEAMPILNDLLALERGDQQTSLRSTFALKKAELKAYGSSAKFSNSETLAIAYQVLHIPSARRHVMNSHEQEFVDRGDIPYEHKFPSGVLPIVKFRDLLLLARIEGSLCHPKSATSFANEAIQIAKDVFSDYSMASVLLLIGEIYAKCGNTTEAMKVYKDVVDMFEHTNHSGSDLSLSKQVLYNCLFEIGNLLKMDEPQQAVEAFSRALNKIDQSTDMVRDAFKLRTTIGRSIAYKNIGETNLAERDILEAMKMMSELTSERLKYMDGEEREDYWYEISQFFQQIVSLCDENSSDTLLTKLYEFMLFSKGFLLSSEHALKSAIYSEDVTDDIRRVYQELEAYE